MKLALITDAWLPQVNGVVTTLLELGLVLFLLTIVLNGGARLLILATGPRGDGA